MKESELFDVIIVGGGMGGGAMALSLSQTGHKVLLIEKGRADAAQNVDTMHVHDDGVEGRLSAGLFPKRIRANLDGSVADIWPTVGCGLGGSTLHYAGTLERLDPLDFEGTSSNSGATPKWPFGYGDLESEYLRAEKLFQVSGTPDPIESNTNYDLAEPPLMSASDKSLFENMRNNGLHPYRVHMAATYNPEGNDGLEGRGAGERRNNAYNRLIEPALETGNLEVMEQTDVNAIEVEQDKAIGVRASGRDGHMFFRAKQIVLAAGALFTPSILLKSKSDAWSEGLGNRCDQAGRNLMFHASDLIAVWPQWKNGEFGPARSIALRDFYFHEGVKLGEIQSMGVTAGYGEILHYWRNRFDESPFRRVPALSKLLSIPALIGSRILKSASVFATIVEDYPYPHNRVILDETSPSGVRIHYEISDELRERVLLMRKLTREAFKGSRRMFLNTPVALNYGHPCGTCRAGDDPSNSVVNRDCKIHGMQNVYIADGSVFPSSGGTNPSLTIAANALRVADVIDTQLRVPVGG